MLTALQEALAEGHGLAMAAGETVALVEAQLPPSPLSATLSAIAADAADLRRRCLDAEEAQGPDSAAELLAHANATRDRAAAAAAAWLRPGTSPVAAWAFLAMTEAGELATWTAIARMAGAAGDASSSALAAWAVPVQERHLAAVLDGARRLALLDDPRAPRRG